MKSSALHRIYGAIWDIAWEIIQSIGAGEAEGERWGTRGEGEEAESLALLSRLSSFMFYHEGPLLLTHG